MKLFEVNNGYVGFGVVKCFVIAENEDRAIEIARHKYKAQSKCYGEHYYLNLTATCLCDDTSKEFVSEITDEQKAFMNQQCGNEDCFELPLRLQPSGSSS